jgi:Calcineurin-like phosphoesterase
VSDIRFVRAQDRRLSLWQSSVAENARRELGDGASALAVLSHPLMQATNDHVAAVLAGGGGAALQPVAGDDRQTAVFLSQLGLEKGMALVDGDAERAGEVDVEFRSYSDIDPGFLSCALTFADYYMAHDGRALYNDWKQQGKGDPEYGVIEWKLPSDAIVGIIGDWGTGLDDARRLLQQVMKFKPAAIIHLGDIYYSGTPEECRVNYTNVISEVFDEALGKGNRIPVFSLAGNHEYYALGYGFYPTVSVINDAIPGAEQVASYFSLRTADGGWQFLAMDTGYGDADPLDQIDPWYAGPGLHTTEVEWLHHQISSFAGVTVLLSHHQLFSAHAKLDGMWSSDSATPYLNTFLREALAPYLGGDVAAWLWGHEHNFAVYEDGLFGLAKGRLLGCSAYEEMRLSEPYKVNYQEVRYLDPTRYRVDCEGGYYDHAYAIVDFSTRARPSDPASISYHQFPSWGEMPPHSPESRLIYREDLPRPMAAPQD